MWDIVTWDFVLKYAPAVGVTLAILGFLLTHSARLRGGLKHCLGLLAIVTGFASLRYKSRFFDIHRQLRNIYLDRIENLDVRATYVPLHVIRSAGVPTLRSAIDVLMDSAAMRTVIIGDPGSGKTTLLKAFGITLLSGTVRSRPYLAFSFLKPNAIPIYVELREFSLRRAECSSSLTRFIVEQVLGTRMRITAAEQWLKRLLEADRCVLVLDGLDEVGAEDYDAVRMAVAALLAEDSDPLPTARARVVMSCRKQNFLAIASDWLPALFSECHTLAPFSDGDIERFIGHRASDLPPGKTPAALWDEIRSSSALELHRSPLILTISLGLYIHIPRYSIPSAVTKFYEETLKELLQRHDFRTRWHLTKRNKFPMEQKLRFLREFAYTMALRAGKFDEFSYPEVATEFRAVQPRLPQILATDEQSFVSEIIDNAGLILRVSGGEVLVFSHRSIHEYLVALQLSKNPAQAVTLLTERCDDPQWRQIILFFGGLDHDDHDALARAIVAKNPELAGHYVAAASSVSVEIVEAVVESLSATVGSHNLFSVLGALSAISRSAPEPVRDKALKSLLKRFTEGFIGSSGQLTALSDLTPDDLSKLVRDLAETRSRDVVVNCVMLSRLAGDLADLVGPLWRCLALYVAANDRRPADERELVARLLELAQTTDGFDALQSHSRLFPAFATDERRRSVYPFEHGHDLGSNLVTLLVWAEEAEAVPVGKNGFLGAFELRGQETADWINLEQDMSKRPLSFSLVWPGRILSWGSVLAATAYIASNAYQHGWSAWLNGVFPGINPYAIVGAAVVLGALSLVPVVLLHDRFPHIALLDMRAPDAMERASPWLVARVIGQIENDVIWIPLEIAWVLIVSAPASLASAVIVGSSDLLGVIRAALASVVTTVILLWWPSTARIFSTKYRVHLRRRNPLIELVSDESSRSWIRRPGHSTRAEVPADALGPAQRTS